MFSYHMQLFGIAFHNDFPFRDGYAGVSFFFILSGFVLTWGGKEGSAISGFYKRRIARIYPTYVTMLVIAWFLPFPSVPGHTLGSALMALFLVQAWSLHDISTIYAINPPSWSLSCEAFFYAGMPLYLPLLRRLKSRVRIAGAIVAFILLVAVAIHGSQWQASWSQIDFTYPLPRLAEFFIGVVAALELRAGHRIPKAAGMLIIAVGLVACYLESNTFPLPDIALDPVWLSIIILSAQADFEGRSGWLASKWLVYFGEVSFAFYLVHQGTLLHMAVIMGPGRATAAVALITAIAGAIVLHHVIELPFQRLILSVPTRFKRSSSAEASPA